VQNQRSGSLAESRTYVLQNYENQTNFVLFQRQIMLVEGLAAHFPK
jgi:hypothetical protein